MKCLNCNEKMEEGYVQVPSVRLAWSPKAKKKSMFARLNWQVDSDEISLGNYNYFRGSKVTAYHCGNCGLIVMNYKDSLKYNL